MPDTEKTSLLPRWAKITMAIVGITAPLCGAVATIATTIYDIKDKAAENKKADESGYQTLAPAVAELQEILEEAQEWVEEKDHEIDDLLDETEEQDSRIEELEEYIAALPRRRNAPRFERLPPMVDTASHTAYAEPQPMAIKKRPSLKIPDTLSKAVEQKLSVEFDD